MNSLSGNSRALNYICKIPFASRITTPAYLQVLLTEIRQSASQGWGSGVTLEFCVLYLASLDSLFLCLHGLGPLRGSALCFLLFYDVESSWKHSSQ